MSTAAGKTSGDEPTPAHLAAYGLSAGELSRFVAPREQPVCQLDARKAFALLTAREQQYALHFSRASWAGALACLATASPESPGILCLLQGLFAGAEAREGIPRSPEGGHELMQYAAAFYGNFSNYASFGDTKIVPRLPAAQFRALVAAHDRADGSLTALFDKLADRIYALGEGDRAIGFAPEGTTGYYGAGITREEAQAVQDVLTANSVNVLNTRLPRDTAESAGPGHYVLLVASAEDGDDGGVAGREFASADGSVRIRTRRGDFARSMQIVADEIAQAGEFAAGEHQANFCKSYVEHFRSGAHEPYIKSQMDWVRDVGPAVETNIGYVETYTDPLGVRAEFEGFVACVNKDTSAKFNALVAAAEPLIAKLPWPKFMEKEAFLKPDFTSLEVVTFGSRGIPAGINIPNLECVRATHGFKNVSLQNVLSARVPDDKATFLRDEDQALFKELQGPAFAVQVGVHELLGHGSGRLLMESAPGKLNFDPAACTDPLTNKPVANWYKPGESWESKFTNLANPYEESRAEAVGVFLAGDPTVLEIFGHKGERAGDVVYVNWLNMVRAGLVALEQYDPESKTWGQAHMRARYAILRVLLADGGGCTAVTRTGTRGGADEDVNVSIDRARLDAARDAIGQYLVRLQTHKSTGDGAGGRAMFEALTTVPADWVELREIVLRRKKPRSVFVQPHLETDKDGSVKYVEFPATPVGVIESFQHRFPPGTAEEILAKHMEAI